MKCSSRFFQSFKNVKTILSSWAVQKQSVGTGLICGCSLLTPVLGTAQEPRCSPESPRTSRKVPGDSHLGRLCQYLLNLSLFPSPHLFPLSGLLPRT